jgi:tRNA threonylcarbamoyladenosine biosynthesis protein TsaE
VKADSGVTIDLPSAADTRALGQRLAGLLRAGDVIVLAGDLGAGKTTLVQGIGQGLGVRGQVASPTFIIARYHPPLRHGPGLLHVDAYRLTSLAQLDDLDLDTELEDAITVIEWGTGLAEPLSADRLEIRLDRARGAGPASTRLATLLGTGPRWQGVALA